jgi:PKD repeat protein
MVPLDASVPGTYLWSNGATSQGIQVNSTGFYHVTVSDQSCESSDSIYVFELLNPVPSFTDSTSNYAVVFTNTTLNGAGAEYLWDFGDGNTSTEEHPIHLYGWTNEDSVAVTVTLTVENVCGIWQFVNDNVWYGNVVSVDNLEGESNLTVYPNPASQMVNLEMNSTNGGNAIIKLLTLNGTVVVSQNLTVSPGNNTYQLNLDGVGKGVYFLEVNQQDDIQVVRLIVN